MITKIRAGIAAIVAVVVLMIIGLIWLSLTREEITPIKITEEEEKEEEEEAIVGYGWSVKSDSKEAVQEAVSLVKKQLKGKTPDFALLFSTVGYDSNEVISEINRLLPDAQIYGGTSMLGVQTKEGFHVGDKASLAILGVLTKKIVFGVGGADLDQELSAEQAGKKAISAAIANAGQVGKLPQLILMTGSVGNEEGILAGIEEVIGTEIPIIGGSSADNDITGKWKQFANDKVYENGVALAAIFTDLKIGWAYEAGFLRTERKGLITKAEGRVIYEIDGKPAAEVYNEWTGGVISKELVIGGPVLAKTTFYPLAKILRGKDGEIHYLSIHPLSVDLPKKSLIVFANVQTGDEILFMRGNWELLLSWAHTTPLKALESEGISKDEVLFGIYTYCAGTMLSIPEKERVKMPLLVNEILGGAPFIGTFTFGEQGYFVGVGNRHGNLVNSMVVFSDK